MAIREGSRDELQIGEKERRKSLRKKLKEMDTRGLTFHESKTDYVLKKIKSIATSLVVLQFVSSDGLLHKCYRENVVQLDKNRKVAIAQKDLANQKCMPMNVFELPFAMCLHTCFVIFFNAY